MQPSVNDMKAEQIQYEGGSQAITLSSHLGNMLWRGWRKGRSTATVSSCGVLFLVLPTPRYVTLTRCRRIFPPKSRHSTPVDFPRDFHLAVSSCWR